MDQFHQVVLGALNIGQSKANELNNTELAPAHLLYGLIKNPKSYSSTKLQGNLESIERMLSSLAQARDQVNLSDIRPSSQLNSWLTQANAHATQAGRQEVAEQDLLRFLPSYFPNLDINYNDFLADEDQEQNEIPTFLVNLNEKASSGKLDPVIGRTGEIRALMEILGRRSKNNPVLVGPAGVGKTAIVEGLAEAIVKDKVPDVLKGKTIYSLELGSLIAGTKYRGEFEERIQQLLSFMKKAAGQYIVFIDEIHQLIGAGKTDGAMDAANLLKPALSRGELHCIGATTEDEFQKYILKDPALERRFRKVPVREPSVEDSIEILMGIRDKFEGHHGIKITDDAIYSAVLLSDQYITDKNLPDKAIDLIDESSAAMKLSAEAMPAELEMLQSTIRNKRILLQVKHQDDLAQEIEQLQKDFDERFTAWESEVSNLKKASELKKEIDQLNFKLVKAEREQNYEEASRIKYSELPELEQQLKGISHDWSLEKSHVAAVISRHTGIPVEKILKSKQSSLLQLEEYLNEHVYGQSEALHEISETLMASYAGLSDQTRPLGSFLLKGPTGVGKTETAKMLAKYLFDHENHIVRIDMSEYSEKHSVSKLIGAAAGYVGYEEGGILTEAVRRHPYSVVLFDEIEKAHPDFADILLQLLDDGRLTDNKGRVVNFKNTIVLLTTNSKDITRDFKPEVLGRLDAILEYQSLGPSVMEKLVRKQINLLQERLSSTSLSVSFSPDAIAHLAHIGFDERYGARPLQNVFSRLVIRPISKLVLKGQDKPQVLEITMHDDTINIKAKTDHDPIHGSA